MGTMRGLARRVARGAAATPLGRRVASAAGLAPTAANGSPAAQQAVASSHIGGPPAEGDPLRDLVKRISRGHAPGAAVVALAREATGGDARTEARGLLMRLVEDEAAAPLGCLGMGVILAGSGLSDAALCYFRRAGEARALAYAAPEYLGAYAREDRDAGLAAVVGRLEAEGETLAPAERLGLLGVLARHRAVVALRHEVERFATDRAAMSALDDEGREQIAWYIRMLGQADDPVPEADGDVSIAIMDYKVLDRRRTSSNCGDYVQTLAALSHLLRFQNVTFALGGELAEHLTALKERVHPERRVSDVTATVVPVPLDRDFSSGRSYPEDTWLICNGWFMHRSFGGDVDFPFPANVNPIMISFHIQDPDVLTPQVVEQLRAYEPIGCRDWTTVYRLRDHGVVAFFSGCVTTTVGQVLTPAAPEGRDRLADVEGRLGADAYPGWSRESFVQMGDHVRDMTLVEGLENARAMLEGYAGFDSVVTSRLHCYLPARSMGLDVHFRPRERSDIRFEGLLDLTPEAFAAMRGRIEEMLEAVLRSILTGASRDEVYALWRRIAAPAVEEADRSCRDYPASIPPAIDVPGVVGALRESRVRRGAVQDGDAMEIAFALDQNLEEVLPVVLQSLVDQTERSARCHILVRGLGEPFFDRLHALFPQLQFDFYDFDAVDYGARVALLSHISVSTMDRLFLPELLDHVDKVVYLDVDILVQGDVGELWDLDLGTAAFAGRMTRLGAWASLVRRVTSASLRLPPEQAWDMRRRLHAVADLTARPFNAGVLVINLALMRAESFTHEHLHLVERCFLNDQDVFNVYAHGRVVELDPRWNSVPSQDCESDPRIVHWAGPAKPWLPTHALFAGRHRETAARVAARRVALGV